MWQGTLLLMAGQIKEKEKKRKVQREGKETEIYVYAQIICYAEDAKLKWRRSGQL